jgi:5'-nucleotidase
MFRMPYFNLDMDGVSANFELHYLECFGHTHNSVPDTEMWAHIDSNPEFFSTIPLMHEVYILFDYVSQHPHGWLTACPKKDFLRVAKQKREWLHLNALMDVDTGFIPSPGGKDKPAYMQHKGAVLVDDFDRNVNAWIAEGGVGILYRDIDQVMEELYQIVRNAQN